MRAPRQPRHVPVRIVKVVTSRTGYCIGETPAGESVFISETLQRQAELYPGMRGQTVEMAVVSNETSRSEIPLRAVYLLDAAGRKIATARQDVAAPTPADQTMVTLPPIPIGVARQIVTAYQDAEDADTAARLLPMVRVICDALGIPQP